MEKLTEIIDLAINKYCSNRLFAELTKGRSDYDACITDCDGHNKKCIAYQSLDEMPIVEVCVRYKSIERHLRGC